MTAKRVLVVDNYDSFVYNLVQYLGELGAEVIVRRSNEIDIASAEALRPGGILISPGPGHPDDATTSLELLATLGRRIPLLGVCLGHQCIAAAFGARVVRADRVMHGKTSLISHSGKGVLAGLPTPFEATRYHSLVIDPASLPAELEVTATADDGTIMAIRHRSYGIEGVQFHPESILTESGKRILENFLAEIPEESHALS